MKQLLIIALACYGLRASAQVQESRNFLYLYSDSVIYAKDIRLRPDFTGNMRIRVDSRSFPTAQVKFFNNQKGFFANTRKLGIMKYGDFSERIAEGRINVFQERKLSYSHFIYDVNSDPNPHFIQNPEPSININMYYNKGYGDLKRLNYKNLKNDIADNPESMDMLYAYRKSINTTNMLYAAASISIVAGIISTISSGKNNYARTNFTTGLSLAVVGLGFATGGYLNSVSAGRKLEDAIDIYNR